MKGATKFWEHFGRRVRERRQALGLRQDDVARRARQAGLPWSRPTVTEIESGRRDLSFPEVLALLGVLDLDLPGLLVDAGALRITPRLNADGDALAGGLRGKPPLKSVLVVQTPRGFRRAARDALASASANYPDMTLGQFEDVEQASAGEAEQKAAPRLGISPMDISVLAFRLWGRSLTEERDARVAERTKDTSPRTVQALRGHATRRLLDELGTEREKRRKKR